MTIANFKSMVAAMVNRTQADLTLNSQDLILHSLNHARRTAQRLHTFEILRSPDIFLKTHANGALWTTGCKATPADAGTAILVKRVDEVWQYETATIDSATAYLPTTWIDFSFSRQLKREQYQSSTPLDETNLSAHTTKKFAYCVGQKLYVTTVTTPTWYKLTGIQWLDDLTDASDPDIFLTYYTDWLLYATLGTLNIHLKDAERFPIDARMVQSLWESVIFHDGQTATMGEGVDLS